MTLEEWVHNNARELSEDIRANINEMVEDCDDAETLHRWIMISIRDRYGERTENSK